MLMLMLIVAVRAVGERLSEKSVSRRKWWISRCKGMRGEAMHKYPSDLESIFELWPWDVELLLFPSRKNLHRSICRLLFRGFVSSVRNIRPNFKVRIIHRWRFFIERILLLQDQAILRHPDECNHGYHMKAIPWHVATRRWIQICLRRYDWGRKSGKSCCANSEMRDTIRTAKSLQYCVAQSSVRSMTTLPLAAREALRCRPLPLPLPLPLALASPTQLLFCPRELSSPSALISAISF